MQTEFFKGEYDETGLPEYDVFKDNNKYSIAGPMFKLLYAIAGTADIPKTNVIFRCTSSTSNTAFIKEQKMTQYDAFCESKNALKVILDVVKPKFIFFEGKSTFTEYFARAFLDGKSTTVEDKLTQGKSPVTFLNIRMGIIEGWEKPTYFVLLPHPSRFGTWKIWEKQAIPAIKEFIENTK
ncbi:MAG: hypothetical protein ACTSWN_15305 [Promethearchaeota archaeon]